MQRHRSRGIFRVSSEGDSVADQLGYSRRGHGDAGPSRQAIRLRD